MRCITVLLLLIVTGPANAADRERAGFVCTAANGATMRLNIDLKRRWFDDGSGWKALHAVTDNVITVRGPNPDMMTTPMGPVLATLILDRTTLVLTDETLIPDRSINRTMRYQCAKGGLGDFKGGRQF